MQPYRAATVVLVALAGLVAGFRPAGSQESAAALTVLVVASADESGAKVTLTFSRRVDYRLEESRSRLRVMLDEPVEEASRVDKDLQGDVLRRVRVDSGSRAAQVVLYLGREFETFSSSELQDPFRLVLLLQRAGAPAASPGGPVSSEAVERPGAEGPEGATGGPGAFGVAWGQEAAEQAGEVRRVVIDPGHGGPEAGAVGPGGAKEKDLVLDISRRLKERLQGRGYLVAMTREDDQRLDLEARAAFANQAGADLFVSIHANGSLRKGVRGAETYFLSYGAADEEAMSVARQENAGEGGPPGSRRDLDLVLWEMAQAAHLSRSSQLADAIQSEMNELAGTRDRGVKQAPFRVLVGAAMPAVLVEVGFLTNEEEARKLASEGYRDQIASALADAVDRFRQQVLAQAGAAPDRAGSEP